MKKFFCVFIVVLSILFMSFQVKASELYTPITAEKALEAVEHVRTTFFAEEFGDFKWPVEKTNVLILDPDIEIVVELTSRGLTTLQWFVFNIGITWPAEYPVEGFEIPKQVLKDPNIPFYFLFHPERVNIMNDMAIKGCLIHYFEHLEEAKSGYMTRRLDFYKLQTDPFYTKAHEMNVIATKDHLGATLCLYEHAKWAEAQMPPAGPNAPWIVSLEPIDFKHFYAQSINLLLIILGDYFPGITVEGLLAYGFIEQYVYDTYTYLMNN